MRNMLRRLMGVLACLLLAVGTARGESALRLGVLAGAPLPITLPEDGTVTLVPVAGETLPAGLDGVLLPADAPLFRKLRDQGALLPVDDLPLYPGMASALTRDGKQIALPLHARLTMLLTRAQDAAGASVPPSSFLAETAGLSAVPAGDWSAWGRALYVQAAASDGTAQGWTDALRGMAAMPLSDPSPGEALFQFGSPFHRTMRQRGWQPVYPVLSRSAPDLPVTLFVGAALLGSQRQNETLAFLRQLMTQADGETWAYLRPDASPVEMTEYTRWVTETEAYLQTLEACAGSGEMCMRMDEFAAQQAEMAPYRYLLPPSALDAISQQADRLSAGMVALPYDPASAPLETLLLQWTWGAATVQDVLAALSPAQ